MILCELSTQQERSAVSMLLDCRRALALNQASDVMIKTKAARSGLQQGDDVLSQHPLAVAPHFFSMKTPEPTEQQMEPVPSRMTPAPRPDALSEPRRNVSNWAEHAGTWPLSCTYCALYSI